MTDSVGAIASRLHDFILAAESKTTAKTGPQFLGQQPSLPKSRADALVMTYTECLRKLDDEERGQLDRMIQKMSEVFTNPPGAVIPQ